MKIQFNEETREIAEENKTVAEIFFNDQITNINERPKEENKLS